MAAYNKFNCFVSDIVHGIHALTTSSTLKLWLLSTNTVPTSTWFTSTDITTQLTSVNGYTTGGSSAQITASTQTAGTFKLVTSNVVWTASSANSTAGIGPFQYVVALENTAAFNLISWYDYGSAVTLNPGETFTVSFDPSSGMFQIV